MNRLVMLSSVLRHCKGLRPLGLVLMMLSGHVLCAQTSKVNAALVGTVEDATGAPLAAAEVVLRNTETNQTHIVQTDRLGFFSFNELPVGTYEIRVTRQGLAAYLSAITLTVGQISRLRIELVPARLQQQVNVEATPPTFVSSETAVTTTIDRDRIEESPVHSRNYLDFVLLSGGVTAASSQPTSSGAPATEAGFVFGGLRPQSNNVSIDGLDNNEEFTGSARTELSPEIVREFQVVNNGLSAEFGGASGGSINVVTKSGTNLFHGDDFIFVQNGALNAETPFEIESRKPHLTRYRAGSSLGGPVKKGRTFFYAAFEQESSRSEAASDVDPQVASAVNRFLAAGGLPGAATRRITTGLFPTSRSETEASGKLNQQIGSSGNLMLRYAFTGNREAGDAFNAGGLTDASARGNSSTSDGGLAGSLTSVPRQTVVNDLRFQVAGRRVSLRTNDTAGPGIDIAGLVDFGRPYFGNSSRNEDRYELNDTVAATAARHLLKAGLTVNHVGLDASTLDGFGGIYIFGSLADFLAFRPDTFRQAFGTPSTDYGVTNTGAFVQDHWSRAKRLTIDLGARYDYEQLPAGFNQDTAEVSPRIGVAYSPSDRWVLRSGFGVFFDRYVLADLNRAVEKNGVQAFEQAAQGRAAEVILEQSQGAPLKESVAGILPSIFKADPHRAASYSEQASLGMERALTTNLTIRADYLFVRGVKLSRTRNVNLLPPAVLTLQNATKLGVSEPQPQQLGRDVFGPGRLDPEFDSVYQLENSASSTYQGISLSLLRRLSNEIEFSASYTLSKSLDDASRFDAQPQDPFDLAAERSLSRNDQRQRFVFSGTFDLPFGDTDEAAARSRGGKRPGRPSRILENVELAPIVTIQSGFPVDALTGVDSNRSGSFPLSSRPLGFARDTLRLPARAAVDLRVVKYIPFGGPRRLDFVAEAFNLLNRVNGSGINPIWGNGLSPLPGFDQPIEAFDAREVQLSVDFEF